MINSSKAMWTVSINNNREIVGIYDSDGESRQTHASRMLDGEYKTVWLIDNPSFRERMPLIKDSHWAYNDGHLIQIIFEIGR